MIDQNQPEATADDLADTVAQLTTNQIRFVIARQEFSTDKQTAEAIEVSPATVKRWKLKGAPIDKAVRLLASDGLVIARELRSRHLAKAMAVKVAGLDSKSDRMAQGVSTEIIEWEMGKAKTSVDVTSAGKPLKGYTTRANPGMWNDDGNADDE